MMAHLMYGSRLVLPSNGMMNWIPLLLELKSKFPNKKFDLAENFKMVKFTLTVLSKQVQERVRYVCTLSQTSTKLQYSEVKLISTEYFDIKIPFIG